MWCEAGAAWRSNDDRFPVVAAGLSRDDIDFPLRMVQTLVLEDPDDAAQLFKDLGGQLVRPVSNPRENTINSIRPQASALVSGNWQLWPSLLPLQNKFKQHNNRWERQSGNHQSCCSEKSSKSAA